MLQWGVGVRMIGVCGGMSVLNNVRRVWTKKQQRKNNMTAWLDVGTSSSTTVTETRTADSTHLCVGRWS